MSRLATGFVVAAISLAACGGGNGNMSDPPPPTNSYDLRAAMGALEEQGTSTPVNLSGTAISGGSSQLFTGTGTFSLSPGTSGTFNGEMALLQTTAIAGTITVGGTSTAFSSSAVNAYDGATAAIVGQLQTTKEIDVASAPIMIPTSIGTMATVLGTLNRYSDSTLSVALGTTQISVDVEYLPIDPGTTEVVQFTFQSYDMSGALVETDTQSYYLSSDSTLSFFGATANNASGSLSVTLQ